MHRAGHAHAAAHRRRGVRSRGHVIWCGAKAGRAAGAARERASPEGHEMAALCAEPETWALPARGPCMLGPAVARSLDT